MQLYRPPPLPPISELARPELKLAGAQAVPPSLQRLSLVPAACTCIMCCRCLPHAPFAGCRAQNRCRNLWQQPHGVLNRWLPCLTAVSCVVCTTTTDSPTGPLMPVSAHCLVRGSCCGNDRRLGDTGACQPGDQGTRSARRLLVQLCAVVR